MPYIGQDWRGPGSSWVRTSSGWQTKSVVVELHRQINKFKRERLAVGTKPKSNQSSRRDGTSSKGSHAKNYLFVPSGWRSPRHSGKFLTPGDILCSFDFPSVLRRRFHYVCRVLDFIIENHFSSMSGSAFNALFAVFEEAVNIAENEQVFIKRILGILTKALEKMKENSVRIVGSRVGHNCRLHVLDSWVQRVGSIELVQREDDGKPTLLNLPVECQRLIFRFLTDPADVIHLSQTCRQLNRMGSDRMLWEELFWYHFTEAQLPLVPQLHVEHRRDWKSGFSRLCKRHPLREEYGIMMERCCHCCFVYWQGSEHPCSSETPKDGENGLVLEPKDIQVEIFSPRELMHVINLKAP